MNFKYGMPGTPKWGERRANHQKANPKADGKYEDKRKLSAEEAQIVQPAI
jgi:hypothetical protein